VSGVFALATTSASEINSLLSEMLNGNDRLSDIVNDKTGETFTPACTIVLTVHFINLLFYQEQKLNIN